MTPNSKKKIPKECEECRVNQDKVQCWTKERLLETLLNNIDSVEENWSETKLTLITKKILNNYKKVGGIDHLEGRDLPSKRRVIEVLEDFFMILFPWFLLTPLP